MSAERIPVTIDRDLEDIVPGYLENRRKELPELQNALDRGDFDTLRILGHRMKGSGAGYGFDRVTEIGRHIEEAAKNQVGPIIQTQIEELSSYLERVEVTYA